MYLASDQAQPTPHGGSCRIRVYLPKGPRDAWVIVCSELPTNEDQGITEAAEKIAAEVLVVHDQPSVVWIEHHPPETTDGTTETLELVVSDSYKMEGRAPYLEKREVRTRSTRRTRPRRARRGRGGPRGLFCVPGPLSTPRA